METGERIKKARKKYGLTQKELAKKLGTTQANISQYEVGNRKPKIETLDRIAKAIGCPISDLTVKMTEADEKKGIAFERYRLVLFHEFIDDEGKAYRLDLPLSVCQVIEHFTRMQYGSAVIIDKMMDDFKEYLLNCLAEENMGRKQ